MALYDAGYLSPIRKKLGNAVGRKWRTLNVLAVYRGTISNPRTEAQQLVRTRFGALARMAMYMSGSIMAGFEAACKGTKIPQRSMFIKENWSSVSADTPGTATVDYSELLLSKGGAVKPIMSAPTFTDPLTVTMTETDTSEMPRCDAHDEVHVVVYDPESTGCIEQVFMRNDTDPGSITIEVPAAWNGHRVHVYAFAIAQSEQWKGQTSDSIYCGTGTIS